jgi:hypothetical protein
MAERRGGMMIKLNTPTLSWKGMFMGVGFKIVKWFDGLGNPQWNYYIHLTKDHLRNHLELIPFVDTREGMGKMKEYVNYDKLADALLFHGGATFCDITALGFIDIGCDYGHYCDLDRVYSEDLITADVEETIIHLHNSMPDLLLWCNGNGNYYTESEGDYTEQGQFYSNVWKQERAVK